MDVDVKAVAALARFVTVRAEVVAIEDETAPQPRPLKGVNVRFLVEEVVGLAPGRALDLACGEGRNALWLAERGWQVTAVDFSAVGLAKAQRLASERALDLRWVEADV